MIVYIFGNPDLPEDSLPLKLIPELQKLRPDVVFEIKDPNEEWEVPSELTVIDTVVGIAEPRIFASLDAFAAAPRLTTHDFDAYANLKWLQKLGRLKNLRIIGLPPGIELRKALDFIRNSLMNG
ncbi:MAG: hypothetical protein WCT10_00355 [Patescibacteria group bacterium]|jgi:hypothetical protein